MVAIGLFLSLAMFAFLSLHSQGKMMKRNSAVKDCLQLSAYMQLRIIIGCCKQAKEAWLGDTALKNRERGERVILFWCRKQVTNLCSLSKVLASRQS